jgi:hypothetical protein
MSEAVSIFDLDSAVQVFASNAVHRQERTQESFPDGAAATLANRQLFSASLASKR